VKASYAKDKVELLVKANEGIEMTRWIIRMATPFFPPSGQVECRKFPVIA
jgi:hypothetical protein